eukprot:2898402-Amphidinium_carterae.1
MSLFALAIVKSKTGLFYGMYSNADLTLGLLLNRLPWMFLTLQRVLSRSLVLLHSHSFSVDRVRNAPSELLVLCATSAQMRDEGGTEGGLRNMLWRLRGVWVYELILVASNLRLSQGLRDGLYLSK